MDAPGVSGDGIYLATFRHQLPPSVSNGKPGSGVKGQGSGVRAPLRQRPWLSWLRRCKQYSNQPLRDGLGGLQHTGGPSAL